MTKKPSATVYIPRKRIDLHLLSAVIILANQRARNAQQVRADLCEWYTNIGVRNFTSVYEHDQNSEKHRPVVESRYIYPLKVLPLGAKI